MAKPEKSILVILFNLGECIWKERFHPYISRGSWDILGWYHSVAKLWFRVHTANAVSRHFWSAALFGATCVYSSMQQGRGACLGQVGERAGRSAWAIWRHRQDVEARCPKGHPDRFQKSIPSERRAWCLRQRWFRSGQKTWATWRWQLPRSALDWSVSMVRKQAESQMNALSVSRSNNSQSESLLFILKWFEIVWLSIQHIKKLYMIWRDIHFSCFFFLLSGGFKHFFSVSPLLGEIIQFD